MFPWKFDFSVKQKQWGFLLQNIDNLYKLFPLFQYGELAEHMHTYILVLVNNLWKWLMFAMASVKKGWVLLFQSLKVFK